MEKSNKTEKSSLRAPIIAVLGHVDHGKTSLLDSIRKTNVQKKEAGGITQSIGASTIITKENKPITFIDTPGHAAFSKMRSRGAGIADIAILVVAADDGVKPQTREALEYIISAKIPYIVAATKMDQMSADIELVRKGLNDLAVQFEDQGGDVPLIPVSAKNNEGIEKLLEIILLLSELNEIGGNTENNLEAYVLETGKDKSGMTLTIVVKDGQLEVGEELVTESVTGKVRNIFDNFGKAKKSIDPGEAGLVIGFSNLPPVGSRVWNKDSDSEIQKVDLNEKKLTKTQSESEIPILVKAKSAGSLEALLGQIPQNIYIIDSGVGDVTESDVFMAKSGDADIFVFEAKTPNSVKKLADTESVKIYEFDIIYKLLDKLIEILESGRVEIAAEVDIIKTFPFDNKQVAGCKVRKGTLTRNDKMELVSGGKSLGTIKVLSMKKNKEDVTTVGQGEEFGLLFVPQLEFQVGDVIISHK